MQITKSLHSAIDHLHDLPGIRGWIVDKYDRKFERAEQVNLFRGVYPSAAAAAAAIPNTKPQGYDHDAPAAMYDERTRQIYPSDYPALFWLEKLLSEQCSKVFDIGGHIGVGYYAYQHYIDFPSTLQWCVSDVPAVVARGQQLAQKRDPQKRLSFTSELKDANGADILFASGSLQYLPMTLADMLQEFSQRPRFLIVNLLPLNKRDTYFTVNSIGTAFCVYRIQKHADFIDGLRELGYELRDHWINLEKRCSIPFVAAEYSLQFYNGFYFERRAESLL